MLAVQALVQYAARVPRGSFANGGWSKRLQVEMNYFEYKSVAERYARHRPYFHPLVIEKVRSYLRLQGPVAAAVDIGCGPGQSTVALQEIADFVAGMDISAEMLGAADKTTGVQYIQSPAEALPIRDACSDLLTTFLAFHWFDRDRFFAEAWRVLKPHGWLVISNNGFAGQMAGSPRFEPWFIEVYLRRYPTPPRKAEQMTAELAGRYGFRFAREEEYENQVQFTVEDLAAYLLTQSNVIAATEQGRELVEEVFDWIVTQARPLFKTERPLFPFRGYIWYLQKLPEMAGPS